jgi:hypothetical protein
MRRSRTFVEPTMTDARDEQDQAESFDPDMLTLGDEETYDDPEGALAYPPERPLGARAYGITPAEERVDEPLDERLLRETRDPLDEIDEPDAEELIAIEAEELLGDDGFDESGDDLDVDEEIARERAVGRLVAPGADDDAEDLDDDEPDAVASIVYAEDLSAEEDAVHLTGDPPFREPGDGYVGADDELPDDLDDDDL